VTNLNFRVEGAEVLAFAAVPTLLFKLCIENLEHEPICAVALHTQLRTATTQRHYTEEEQVRLAEVFGELQRWGRTLKSMVWTHTTVLVPPFSGRTVIEMPVPCTYDFEVVSAKYFHALQDGDIPLEFLFSGQVFYRGETGALQIVQIPWEKEAQFRLPLRLWQQMMQHYFPNSAWLRVHKDVFDRLYRYKVQQGLPTWEAALERLSRVSQEGELSCMP
jgi:Family of unknown function (DUF6084)